MRLWDIDIGKRDPNGVARELEQPRELLVFCAKPNGLFENSAIVTLVTRPFYLTTQPVLLFEILVQDTTLGLGMEHGKIENLFQSYTVYLLEYYVQFNSALKFFETSQVRFFEFE